jgi:hypothetical protein
MARSAGCGEASQRAAAGDLEDSARFRLQLALALADAKAPRATAGGLLRSREALLLGVLPASQGPPPARAAKRTRSCTVRTPSLCIIRPRWVLIVFAPGPCRQACGRPTRRLGQKHRRRKGRPSARVAGLAGMGRADRRQVDGTTSCGRMRCLSSGLDGLLSEGQCRPGGS